MKLRFSSAALRQIDEALAYIAARSPQGAANLQARIETAARLLQDHPHAAQATSRARTRRIVLAPQPYAMFYRVAGGEIVVTRFRHTSRCPI